VVVLVVVRAGRLRALERRALLIDRLFGLLLLVLAVFVLPGWSGCHCAAAP
jgi:hypothetical protein